MTAVIGAGIVFPGAAALIPDAAGSSVLTLELQSPRAPPSPLFPSSTGSCLAEVGPGLGQCLHPFPLRQQSLAAASPKYGSVFSGLLRKSWETGLGKPRGHLGLGHWCQRRLPVPVPGTSPARAVPAGPSPQHLLFLTGHQQLHDQQHSCQPAPGHPPACSPRQPVRVPHWQRRLQDQGDPRGAWCPAQGSPRRGGIQVSPRANPCAVPAPGMWHHRDFFGAPCIFSAWQAETQGRPFSARCCPSQLDAWVLAPPFPRLLTASSLAFSEILEREMRSAVSFSTGCCWINSARLCWHGDWLGLGYRNRLSPGPPLPPQAPGDRIVSSWD